MSRTPPGVVRPGEFHKFNDLPSAQKELFWMIIRSGEARFDTLNEKLRTIGFEVVINE